MKTSTWILLGVAAWLIFLALRSWRAARAGGTSAGERIFTGTSGDPANSILGELQAGFDEITKLLTAPKAPEPTTP